jgi:diguanylate cyclase (GGDEF)-like protein
VVAQLPEGSTLTGRTDIRADNQLGWLVLDSLHDATAVVDRRGTIVAVNAAWDRFRSLNEGRSAACGVGADYLGVCATAAATGCHDALLAYEGLRDVLSGRRTVFELEYPCPSPTEDRWFLQRITPLRGASGVVVSHVDITRRKQAELQLSETASRDSLTGLLNRTAIEAVSPTNVAVLFIDLDGFKSVNDQLGHATGDDVLARAANRILHNIRPADQVARVGGDEFVVILHDPALNEVEAVASRVENAVSAPYQVGPNTIQVGASVGIAHGSPGETISAVVARADSAMYKVKRSRAGSTQPPEARGGPPAGR